MYTHKVTRLPKKTVEILVTIPKENIQQEADAAFVRLSEQLEVPGYRKGKVPKEIAKKHISKESIYQEAIRALVPNIYEEIVKKEGFQPIITPKIELIKAKENEDWEVKITLAEKPEIVFANYKEGIAKLKAERKKEDIWVPGKDKTEKKEDNAAKQKLLNDILSLLLKETDCEISDLILEEELNNRLTRLVDDVQKIGLTVESYLKSKNLTIDKLKEIYKREIEDTYRLEFILIAVADREGIKVEPSEIEALFKNIKDEKERALASQNAYYYASILRKQKTLDYLLNL